jgi:hypothetical protein
MPPPRKPPSNLTERYARAVAILERTGPRSTATMGPDLLRALLGGYPLRGAMLAVVDGEPVEVVGGKPAGPPPPVRPFRTPPQYRDTTEFLAAFQAPHRHRPAGA